MVKFQIIVNDIMKNFSKFCFIFLTLSLFLSGCAKGDGNFKVDQPVESERVNVENDKKKPIVSSTSEEKLPKKKIVVVRGNVSAEKEKSVKILSDKILAALKNKDFKTVASFVGTDKKLCFSPYVFVSELDKCFSKDELAKAFAGSEKYVWGAYDGRGDEILLTFSEYYQQFVYNKDYLNKSEYFFNQTGTRGNTLSNFGEAYPNGFFSEYYIKVDEDSNDWDSLNMVFEEVDGQLYLRALIHDQWTI